MSAKLKNYLLDSYVGHTDILLAQVRGSYPIQIDDQDDDDPLEEFCNIFVTVGKKNRMKVEISGRIPITYEIADLAEIYDGYANRTAGKVVLRITPGKVDVLSDLADKIRKTAYLGDSVGNPNWDRISARTISSLKRFIRLIKQFDE